MIITKTIIPAAGCQDRFLPLSKTLPREMLPLLNKPAMHYIVEESLASEIKNIIIITNHERDQIMNYFDTISGRHDGSYAHYQQELLVSLEKIIRNAIFTYIRQPEPMGLGHAILMAGSIIDPKEYVSIMLPDDIIINNISAINQLKNIAYQERASVIAVQEVPRECLSNYGVIAVKKQLTPRLFQVGSLVEKPKPHEAPSNLAVVGRYIISGKIINHLSDMSNYATNELQLTDALSAMIKHNEKLFAYKIQGTRFDIGTPIGWLKAMIALSLESPLYGPDLKKFVDSLNSIESYRVNHEQTIVHNNFE